MTIFPINSKNLFPNFGGKNVFLPNLGLVKNLIWVSSIMPKFRKRLKFQFKENIQRKKERIIDGRLDRPYFIRPLWVLPEVQLEVLAMPLPVIRLGALLLQKVSTASQKR